MNLLKKGIGVVGSTTIDKIIAEDHSFLKLGGVTTYAGITYHRHGIPAFIISNMAEQDLEVMSNLHAEDSIVCSAKSDLSTYFVNFDRGGRRYQQLLQQAGSIRISQIHAIVDRVDGLHLGPLHPLDIEKGALKSLLNLNLKIFLDAQGYTRKVKNKKIYRSVSVQMATGLTLAHIVKANEAEYNAILAFYQMTLADLVRRFEIEEFVVTLGDKGGFVQKLNGETFHYDAALIKKPVDPTGAGDVFLAAYIASRFTDRKDIPDACIYAAKIAARQVEGKYITKDVLALSESHEKFKHQNTNLRQIPMTEIQNSKQSD
jgi:sugar/nucleoside kinase (ribokinase family)